MVLLPYLAVSSVAIIRTMERIVNGDNKGQDPGDKSQNLVYEDGIVRMGVPLPEGIVY